jgi:hypothetical protein
MDVNSPEAAMWSENMRLKSENANLRDWIYEALNSLGDPQDASDHSDSEVAALRATIGEAIGKLRTGLGHGQSLKTEGQ